MGKHVYSEFVDFSEHILLGHEPGIHERAQNKSKLKSVVDEESAECSSIGG